VGCLLWYRMGVTGERTTILTRQCFRGFQMPPETGRRGLAALERAGLVQVVRQGRRSPEVTVIVSESKRAEPPNRTGSQMMMSEA
jgi:hypothetical protein